MGHYTVKKEGCKGIREELTGRYRGIYPSIYPSVHSSICPFIWLQTVSNSDSYFQKSFGQLYQDLASICLLVNRKHQLLFKFPRQQTESFLISHSPLPLIQNWSSSHIDFAFERSHLLSLFGDPVIDHLLHGLLQ